MEQRENKNEEIGDILCFPFVFGDFKELQVWVVIVTQIRFVVFHMLSNQKHMAALPVNFLNLSYHSSRSNTAVFATSQI